MSSARKPSAGSVRGSSRWVRKYRRFARPSWFVPRAARIAISWLRSHIIVALIVFVLLVPLGGASLLGLLWQSEYEISYKMGGTDFCSGFWSSGKRPCVVRYELSVGNTGEEAVTDVRIAFDAIAEETILTDGFEACPGRTDSWTPGATRKVKKEEQSCRRVGGDDESVVISSGPLYPYTHFALKFSKRFGGPEEAIPLSDMVLDIGTNEDATIRKGDPGMTTLGRLVSGCAGACF